MLNFLSTKVFRQPTSTEKYGLVCTLAGEENSFRKELDRVRESSKLALLESWEEVEHLQLKNAQLCRREHELHNALEAAMRREQAHKMQLEELKRHIEMGRMVYKGENNVKAKILPPSQFSKFGIPDDECSQGTMDSFTQFRDDISTKSDPLGDRSCKAQRAHSNQRKECLEVTLKMTEKLHREKEMLAAAWQLELDCRDNALQQMQYVTMVQYESIEELSIKLDTHSTRYKEKETKMKKDIKFLKRKLNEKRSIIAKQFNQLDDYKHIIDELTSSTNES